MKKNPGKFSLFLYLVVLLPLYADENLSILDPINSYPVTAVNLDELFFYLISMVLFIAGLLLGKWWWRDHV